MPKENDELSLREIERQDIVDNAIFCLIEDLIPETARFEWNIEYIAEVRDVLQNIIVDELKIMTELEFYPYIELDGG